MDSIRIISTAATLVLIGCSQAAKKPEAITLATTTSTRDSGLLDVLVPLFEKKTGIEVQVVAVGSGQALELGRRGDADVLVTHAPQAEEQFMAAGFGESRRELMYNDFVLVGPKSDPANIRSRTSILEAFRQIAGAETPFVSRGDDSGTHMKEQEIWRKAGIDPQGDWYIRAGAGMAEALRMASEKKGYTLGDRGTFLAQRKGLDLIIVAQRDPLLRNQYSVIVLSHEKHPQVNRAAARRLAEFLLSREVQKTIAEFGVDRFGQPLFFPQSSCQRPTLSR